MGIGTSIFLLALGAILAFAVEFDVAGLDINTIGLILMAAGIIGLLISTLYLSRSRTAAPVASRDVQALFRLEDRDRLVNVSAELVLNPVLLAVAVARVGRPSRLVPLLLAGLLVDALAVDAEAHSRVPLCF